MKNSIRMALVIMLASFSITGCASKEQFRYKDEEITSGDQGDVDEVVSLNKGSWATISDVCTEKNQKDFSFDGKTFDIKNADIRFTKAAMQVCFTSLDATYRDVVLHFRTGEEKKDMVLRGVATQSVYNVILDLDSNKEFQLIGYDTEAQKCTLSEPKDLGTKEAALVSDNTLKYRHRGVLLVYNKYGEVIDWFVAHGKGERIIATGGKYYNFIE